MKTLKIIAAGTLVAVIALSIIGCGGGTSSVNMRSGKVYFHQNKDYAKAEALFKKAVAEDPNNWEAHYYLALSLTMQNKFDEAGPEFDAAYSLAPEAKKADVRQNQRAVFSEHFNAGNSARDSGNLEEAVSEYRKAVGVYAHDASGYINLGLVLSRLGRTDEAEQMMKQAVGIDSTSAPAWNNLGALYLQTKKHDEAALAFEKVAALAPKDPELIFSAVYSLGNIYFDKKEYDKALKNYTQAAEIKGSDAGLQYQIGVTYLLLEKYQEAEGALQKCASLTKDSTDPDMQGLYGDAMYNLAVAYIQVQNYDGAIDTLKTLLARQETADLHEALGRAYSRKGEKEKALEELRKAQELRNK